MAVRQGRYALLGIPTALMSLDGFSWQFLFERRWWPNRIPNWAWGHEIDIGLLRKYVVGKGPWHHSLATEDCQTRSSSKTPHAATKDGLSVSTKCVTFALDKDAKSDREDQQPEGCEKEEKASDS